MRDLEVKTALESEIVKQRSLCFMLQAFRGYQSYASVNEAIAGESEEILLDMIAESSNTVYDLYMRLTFKHEDADGSESVA